MIAKQKRSRDRVKIIIKTAREILTDGDVSDITIAKVSELSELKRTSTYKFFPTPDHIKIYLLNELIHECSTFMKSNIKIHNDANLQSILNEVVTMLINYFDNSVVNISKTKFKETVNFGQNVLIGENVSIGSNCKIGHNTIVEKNVSIGIIVLLAPTQ